MERVSFLVFQSVFVFSAHLLQSPLVISEETNFIFILYSSKFPPDLSERFEQSL